MILLSVDENVRIYSCTASGSVIYEIFRSAIWQKIARTLKTGISLDPAIPLLGKNDHR